jgi:hypothetical protein
MSDLIDRRLALVDLRRRVQRSFDAAMPILTVSVGLAATAVVVIRIALPEAVPLIAPIAAVALLAPVVAIRRRIGDGLGGVPGA